MAKEKVPKAHGTKIPGTTGLGPGVGVPESVGEEGQLGERIEIPETGRKGGMREEKPKKRTSKGRHKG